MGLKQSSRTYDQAVIDYVNKEGGALVFTLNDSLLQNLLKYINGLLGFDKKGIFFFDNFEQAESELDILAASCKSVLFFVDYGPQNLKKVRKLKKNNRLDVKVICVSDETDRDNAVLMHEMGADNIIIRPVSLDSIMEKTARVVKPELSVSEDIRDGKMFLHENRLSEAEAAIGRVLEKKPKSSIAYMLKGDVAKKRGEHGEAERHYETALSFNPMFLEPHKRLAALYRELGELEKLLKRLEELDKLSPLNTKRKQELGVLHIKTGNTDKGREYLDAAIARECRVFRKRIYKVVSRVSEELEEHAPEIGNEYMKKALDEYDSVDYEQIWMVNRVGLGLRREGRWQEAIQYYQKGLENNPEESGLHFNIAMAYAQGKRYGDAAKYMINALNYDYGGELTQVSSSLDKIVKVFKASGHKDRAKKYQKILESLVEEKEEGAHEDKMQTSLSGAGR